MFKVFSTLELATEYAIKEYGITQVETLCAVPVKVGPTIARYYGCEVGYAISHEMVK